MKRVKPVASITVGPKRALTGGVVMDPDFIWTGGYPNKLVRLNRKDLSRSGSFPPLVRVRRVSASTVFGGFGECRAVRRSDGMPAWEAKSLYSWQLWSGSIVIPREAEVELRRADSGEVFASLPLQRRVASFCAFGACDGVVVLRAESKEVFAVDLSSGRELWCRDLFGSLHGEWSLPEQPYLLLDSTEGSGGLVSFYSTASIAWSPRDGSIKWVRNIRGEGSTPPTVSGSRVFGVMDEFWALDEATGKELWRTPVPREFKLAMRPRPCVVYRNRLGIAFESGQLAVLDTESGEIVQYYKDRVPLWWPVEVDGRLLVGTGDGTILVFDESIWGL